MLTDYHLHLRPGRGDTTAERYFTAENVERYLEAAAAAGIEELGVSEHVYRFSQALDLWRHPLWVEHARDDLDAYCEFVRGDAAAARDRVRLRPRRRGPHRGAAGGARLRLRRRLGPLRRRATAVDHDGWDVWEGAGDPDEVWRRYFEALAECARSGLFDILAHPDLVKVWGRARPLPERDPRRFYEPAVEAIAESGIAVEVSTAGLRKPVGELYPGAGLRRDVRRGRRPVRALLRRPPARAGRLRLRPRARVPRRPRGRGDLRLRAPRSGGWSRCRRRVGENPEPMSVGIGYDSHRFAEGRRLVLGGVEIEHERGLEGHSDADVLTHAVIDALLGAAGCGDIGTLFPDDDERWRDADSIDLLRTVVGTIAGRIVNIDATLICEAAAARPLQGRDGADPRRGDLGPGQRQGDHQRGHGLDRPRRGHRLHRRGCGG